MRAYVTQETLAIKAQSADVAVATASICNAEGVMHAGSLQSAGAA